MCLPSDSEGGAGRSSHPKRTRGEICNTTARDFILSILKFATTPRSHFDTMLRSTPQACAICSSVKLSSARRMRITSCNFTKLHLSLYRVKPSRKEKKLTHPRKWPDIRVPAWKALLTDRARRGLGTFQACGFLRGKYKERKGFLELVRRIQSTIGEKCQVYRKAEKRHLFWVCGRLFPSGSMFGLGIQQYLKELRESNPCCHGIPLNAVKTLMYGSY